MLKFIIHRKTFISMLFVGLTMLGYISYRELPVELLPEAELPMLIIQVGSSREMDPAFMEKNAIVPLEGAVETLEGIEKIESFADRRQGRIIVSYNTSANIKFAYLRLQEKVDAVKSGLGDDFFVSVLKVDTEQLANMFMNLQVRGSGGLDRIRNLTDRDIVPELEAIDGIANVEVFGGQQRSVEIVMNKQKSEAYNLTPSRIQSLIASNSQKKTYVGRVDDIYQRYFVNVVAEYTEISDLENIVVEPTIPVLLKDVATVYQGLKEETSISRVNGKEALTIQLVRDTRENMIDLSQATRAVIERLNNEQRNNDLEIVIQYDGAEYLEDNIDLIIDLALTGGLLAILILWLFLRNLPLVSIIALAIPVSVFTSFNFFYAFGISLNSLTLVGMALAIGMLLDNSIVVLENIYRLANKKMDPEQAALQGTQEVSRSIIAATLTTMTVFVPFVFASNYLVKLLGYQIGVSIISTLTVSLIVALLLIPMVTHYYLIKSGKKLNLKSFSHRLRSMQVYTLFLKSSMRRPLRVVLTSVILFFSSLLIALGLSLNASQEVELDNFNLYVTMPSGATLESTDLAVGDLEKLFVEVSEIKDVISQIYEEEAILTLQLKEDFKTIGGRDIAGIKEDVDGRISRFDQAEVSFEQPETSNRFRGGRQGSGGGQAGMDGAMGSLLGIGSQTEKIVLKGQDFEVMRNFADDISYQLEELSSINWSRVAMSDNRPEIHLYFDRELMNRFGINMGNVVSELASFQNEVSSGMTYKQGNDSYDIIIRIEDYQEKSIDDLRQLTIQSDEQAGFPLSQISQVIYAEGQSSIRRVNQEREIEVRYKMQSEISDSKTYLEAARLEIDQLIGAMEIPQGIAVEVVHDETDLSDFYFLIGVAFILIFMILASVFESLLTPFVIMFTIPLAAIGSLWAIIFTGNSLINANTLIGFLILLGIVVNNGIILIDYTRLLRERGNTRSRALVVAGQARLRPILITAITTIIAMLPLALGKTEYVTRIAAPFAITVIGGLTLSTLFTLIFIPTVYSALESIVKWIRTLNWKLNGVQLTALIGGTVLIYFKVDSLIWQSANFLLLLFVVPALTYFIMNSLRQASVRLINPDEAITISIKNLHKIYDHPGRFTREWRKGQRLKEQQAESQNGWLDVVWRFGYFMFLIFYVYFYLDSLFWQFVFVHAVYFSGLYLWSIYSKFTTEKVAGRIDKWFTWLVPLLHLVWFFFSWDNITVLILTGLAWYFLLSVYTTSHRLHRLQININRIKGRFVWLRRNFYRLVQITPLVGKKKTPFAALKGVSLEIGTGMFGLLGPNGAGKTTLMRIICGIFDQSYGSVKINGIDTRAKREELQGLIGYLPQEFGTYENMSADDFLQYQAILKGLTNQEERHERINYVLGAVHLTENRHQKIGSFSGGMKQRVGIAQTLLHLPRILVVDEPTAGLDPRERIRFRNLLVELSRERVVIFSTHIIEDIASSCDKVAVLNRGELRYLGEPRNMTRLAEGSIYQFHVPIDRFEEIRQDYVIIHHIRVDDQIRVRCLQDTKPAIADAIAVKPTLEDAYLCLAGGRRPGEQEF